MKETDLYEQLAQYMNLKHPNVIYHFDLSGVNNPSHKSRNLYGRLNSRAWPDLFVGYPLMDYAGTAGLFIELKREGTKLYKKDGSLVSNPHFQEQAQMLQRLQEQGYQAVFAVGYDEAVATIERYLSTGSTEVSS